MPSTSSLLWSFFILWGSNTAALWITSYLFSGITFKETGALVVAGLLLGLANVGLRPLLIILTLPLSILTLGFFLLVINALMFLLVAWLVNGFEVTGFWTGFFAAIIVSIVNGLIGWLLPRKS